MDTRRDTTGDRPTEWLLALEMTRVTETAAISAARLMGHGDEERVYRTEDLATGDNIVFAATGVTDGDLLHGVRFIDTVHMLDRGRPPSVRL